MTAAAFLDRLHGARPTGHNRWLAKCPAHQDRRPSLSVRELDDGRVLVHDFSGCTVADIVAAIGLELHDLFPPAQPNVHSSRPRASSLTPLLVAFERDLLIVHVFLSDVAKAKPISEADRITAHTSAAAIWAALQEARHVI